MILTMIWLGIVWLFLGIYALAMLAFTLVRLFFKVCGAYRALCCIELPESDVVPPDTQIVSHTPGPTGDPETLSNAWVRHQEVKQQRRVNKQCRLRRAQERWVSHELVGAPR